MLVVKDDVSFAGNVEIGNNVTINKDCMIQAIGHNPYYEGRHLTQTPSGGLSEISTSGIIKIEDDVNLAEGTKVVPGVTVQNSTQPDELVLK